jgi:raffinose/stachyose/melibiose transport system permease protein
MTKGHMGKKIKAKQIILTVIMGIIAVFTLFPIYFLFVNSFKSQSEIVASPISISKSWDFSYLANATEKIDLLKSMGNSILITVLAVGLIVLVSSQAAWALVRNKTKFTNIVFLCFTSSMLIPFQSVMYPLMNMMDKIGLKNITGLIIMYGGFGLSMSILLYHGFLKSVPLSLEEAAVIDGANVFQVYLRVVMPLVKPTTVTVIITNAVWIWNDYLLPFLTIGNNSSKTLTLSLYYAKSLLGQYGNPWELIFPAVLISSIPMIFVFIILQRNIIEGIAAGAVKG